MMSLKEKKKRIQYIICLFKYKILISLPLVRFYLLSLVGRCYSTASEANSVHLQFLPYRVSRTYFLPQQKQPLCSINNICRAMTAGFGVHRKMKPHPP